MLYSGLTHKVISYRNHMLSCSINKKSGDLRITNLPPDSERHEIEDLINSHIPGESKVSKCVIVRKNPYESSNSEMEQIKKSLFEMFGQFTPINKLSIDIKKATTKDTKWNAFVFFKNAYDGETAVSILTANNKIHTMPALKMNPSLQTYLYCKLEIFSAIKDQISEALKFFKDNSVSGNNLEITVLTKGEDNVQIHIVSNNVSDITDARKSILNILLGDQIDCRENPTLAKLFTTLGQEHIKKIAEEFPNCYIELNKFKKVITIFGDITTCNSVKVKLNELLDQLGEEQLTEISLLPDSGKPGVLHKLLKKYGHDLAELKSTCGLGSVVINSRRHIITVMGSDSSISECQNIIQKFKAEMEEIIENEDEEEICPVCFVKVSTDAHRLEYCGHAYCRECVLHLLQSSNDFPLLCIKHSCSENYCSAPVVLADIQWMEKEAKVNASEVFKKALTAYIRNSEDLHYCPSPDCPMIFRVTNDPNIFDCPSCSNSICTRCKEIYHYGISCSLYQCLKGGDDAEFVKIWLEEDPENHKVCPTCSSPIEKNGGCNHMTCLRCKSHICWLCLQVFNSSSLCYEHQSSCPRR